MLVCFSLLSAHTHTLLILLHIVFGIYLNAYSYSLLPSTNIQWNEAPLYALDVLTEHTPAKPGDRTVIDALHPFCIALAYPSEDADTKSVLARAVRQAVEGAIKTKDMMPKLGRATYVQVDEGGTLPMDPGAWGVAKLLEGFVDGWITGVRIVDSTNGND